MVTEDFFNTRDERSRVKARIVADYFEVWAKVVLPSVMRNSGRIAYFDLFAGPGRYEDGSSSTPLMVLEKAIAHPGISKALVSVFNDKDEQKCQTLEKAIQRVSDLEKLSHQPKIWSEEVDEHLAEMFEERRIVPALFFIDPWGYKGLSSRLINSVLKDWGCDCIFFFNYRRINMGLNNDSVFHHMCALFGAERAKLLRNNISTMTPSEREQAILTELSNAMMEYGPRIVVPFRFTSSQGRQTSHFLIFVSKHFRGYEIMKEIMAKESSTAPQGVPSFTYDPMEEKQPTLIHVERPLDDLCDILQKEFAGLTLTRRDIYEQHSIGTPFIKDNYRVALLRLEEEDIIITNPPSADRRRGTLAENTVQISFPKLGDN